jgi:hypothetical protein
MLTLIYLTVSHLILGYSTQDIEINFTKYNKSIVFYSDETIVIPYHIINNSNQTTTIFGILKSAYNSNEDKYIDEIEATIRKKKDGGKTREGDHDDPNPLTMKDYESGAKEKRGCWSIPQLIIGPKERAVSYYSLSEPSIDNNEEFRLPIGKYIVNIYVMYSSDCYLVKDSVSIQILTRPQNDPKINFNNCLALARNIKSGGDSVVYYLSRIKNKYQRETFIAQYCGWLTNNILSTSNNDLQIKLDSLIKFIRANPIGDFSVRNTIEYMKSHANFLQRIKPSPTINARKTAFFSVLNKYKQ